MRRVLSSLDDKLHPEVQRWRSEANDHGYKVNKSQCILAGSLAKIVKELADQGLSLDKMTVEQAELNTQAKLYLEWVRERSPLALTLRNLHSRVRRLYDILSAMLEKNRQKNQASSGKEAPAIVRATAHYCCLVMGAIQSVVSAIAGDEFDRVNWYGGCQHPVMRSNQFKRCLWNELGEYLKARNICIHEDFPWLFRYTENIKRDCAGWIIAAYARVGVGYDPSEIPPVLSYPTLTKDLNNRPLDKIYLIDFTKPYLSTLNPDDRSEVSDLTHLSRSNESLVSQVQKEPPVIPKPPVRTDYVDKRSSNSRSRQANNKPSLINKHYDNVINHKQRQRHEESDEDEDPYISNPDIEGATRLRDTFAAHWPKYNTPYTNSRSKGVVPRTLTRASTAAPSMSWLTSASVANIRRGVQGFGTPTSPSLLYSNLHNTHPSQVVKRQSEPLGSSTARS